MKQMLVEKYFYYFILFSVDYNVILNLKSYYYVSKIFALSLNFSDLMQRYFIRNSLINKYKFSKK